MKKIIHCVYINDYFPELWVMCLPTIKQYAYKTKSELNIITLTATPQILNREEKKTITCHYLNKKLNLNNLYLTTMMRI